MSNSLLSEIRRLAQPTLNKSAITDLPSDLSALDSRIVALIGSAPAALDTFQEVAAELDTKADASTTLAGYGITDALNVSARGALDGVASLDSNGKIVASQLPAIAITDTYVVASEVAMLALIAETGDVAVRSDITKCFILKGTDPTVLGDWQELLNPASGVSTVAGRSGTVVLTAADLTSFASLPYDISASVFSMPLGGEVVTRFVTSRAFTIPENFVGSFAKAGIVGTGSSAVFVVKKNGTQVATVTFAVSSTSGTWSAQGAISFAAGDQFSITAPGSPNATLADIDFAISAVL